MNIEALAREAGLTDPDLAPWMTDYGNAETAIRQFAALVRASALEEAAQACEDKETFQYSDPGSDYAEAIRALAAKPQSKTPQPIPQEWKCQHCGDLIYSHNHYACAEAATNPACTPSAAPADPPPLHR